MVVNTMTNRLYSLVTLVGLCALLSACSVYRVRPLRPVTRETAHYGVEKDNVSIYAASIEPKELKYYFNNIVMRKKQGTPVLVTVTNRDVKTIKVLLQNTCAITQNMEKYGAWRMTKTGAAAIVALGLGYTASYMIIMGCWNINPLFMVLSWPMICAFPGVIIFCIAAGIHAHQMGTQFYTDFMNDLQNKLFAKVQLDIGDSETKLVFITPETIGIPLSFEVRKKLNDTWQEPTIFALNPIVSIVAEKHHQK